MFKMRLLLSLVVVCLALNNGMGAPTKARYMFVRCNPSRGQANCVTHRSAEMAMDPDLPSRLPASATQYMEEEPVVEEEEGESPMKASMLLPEEGSGGIEGSVDDLPFMDRAFMAAEPEAGSGESWTEKETGLYQGLRGDAERMSLELLFLQRDLVGEARPAEQELREDHLLQL